jgi:hypothetical protein
MDECQSAVLHHPRPLAGDQPLILYSCCQFGTSHSTMDKYDSSNGV